jgi:hypothetical protein
LVTPCGFRHCSHWCIAKLLLYRKDNFESVLNFVEIIYSFMVLLITLLLVFIGMVGVKIFFVKYLFQKQNKSKKSYRVTNSVITSIRINNQKKVKVFNVSVRESRWEMARRGGMPRVRECNSLLGCRPTHFSRNVTPSVQRYCDHCVHTIYHSDVRYIAIPRYDMYRRKISDRPYRIVPLYCDIVS